LEAFGREEIQAIQKKEKLTILSEALHRPRSEERVSNYRIM